jgi:hypothetical protein
MTERRRATTGAQMGRAPGPVSHLRPVSTAARCLTHRRTYRVLTPILPCPWTNVEVLSKLKTDARYLGSRSARVGGASMRAPRLRPAPRARRERPDRDAGADGDGFTTFPALLA